MQRWITLNSGGHPQIKYSYNLARVFLHWQRAKSTHAPCSDFTKPGYTEILTKVSFGLPCHDGRLEKRNTGDDLI